MTVEVGGWEHACCGPAYERGTVVELTCLVVPGPDDGTSRHVETHHDTDSSATVTVRGRVTDLRLEHSDGTSSVIRRLPGGRALRGFDDEDDGHLEDPWTGEPVIADSDRYLPTVRP